MIDSRRSIRWRTLSGYWLLGMVIFATYYLFINGTSGNLLGRAVQADYRLMTRQRETTATVTTIGLPHYGCSYTYTVDEKTFSNAETGCGADPVGSTLTVRYLPARPAIASTGNPTSEFWEGLVMFYGAPLFFAVFLTFGSKQYFGRRQRDPTSTMSWALKKRR